MSYPVFESVDIALTTSASTTALIHYAGFRGGVIKFDSGTTATTLTYYTKVGTEFVPLYDEFGVQVTQNIAASRGYELKSAAFGLDELYLVLDVADTVTVALKT